MKVFIMDTWAYPYRLPVFELLHREVEIETFFSRPQSFDHLDDIDFENYSFRCYSGNWLLALIPIHLLWKKYDVYMVGQIGVASVPGAFFTLLVAAFRKKPLVLWTDYIETDTYKRVKKLKRRAGDFIRTNFVRHCAAVIGFGSYTERYLKKIGPDNLRVFNMVQVVPEVCNRWPENPEDTEKPRQYKDKVVLLCLGYLRKNKGGDLLIRAFRQMRRTDAVLMIAGSGKEETEWKALAGGCEAIRFVGHVADEEKARRYLQADIFILPTEHDTWGLVVNEAMYYGLPVVVSDAAGASELITDNGIVFESGNERMLREALTRLIEDSELRKKMGENSKTRIAGYGTEYAAGEFLKVITHVSEKPAATEPVNR